MSIIKYISFPRELEPFYLLGPKGQEEKFGIDISKPTPWEIDIFIMDKRDAVFNDCFKNSFIYGYSLILSEDYYDQRNAISQKNLENETKRQELELLHQKGLNLRDQTLYNFLNKILSLGEFVEIYTTWHDHINFNFGPPTTERTMSLEEILTTTAQEDAPDFDTSRKLTICKTK
ncbi:MAG: hypothetical protein FWC91_12730 [Defluviitaleaceae bacterium]|nr:hypothetical protein [Defluviitaleaceae bacterium]